MVDRASSESFTDFAKKRLAGADKISSGAKSKGGAALLTYHHFVVKLPYYKEAAVGKFNPTAAQGELSSLTRELDQMLADLDHTKQVAFQRLVGKVEVLGELLIAITHRV